MLETETGTARRVDPAHAEAKKAHQNMGSPQKNPAESSFWQCIVTFRTTCRSAYPCGREGGQMGETAMTSTARFFSELLLFAGLLIFITGIVLAAANLPG